MIYELVGGPLDGEDIMSSSLHLRIGFPYACVNGCCIFYELYDWDDDSDDLAQLFYAGRQAAEETDAYDHDDWGYWGFEPPPPPKLLGNSIHEEELWEIWDTDLGSKND